MKANDRRIVEKFIKEDAAKARKELKERCHEIATRIAQRGRCEYLRYDVFTPEQKACADRVIACARAFQEAVAAAWKLHVNVNNHDGLAAVNAESFYVRREVPISELPNVELLYATTLEVINQKEREALIALVTAETSEAKVAIDGFGSQLKSVFDAFSLASNPAQKQLTAGDPQ